MMSPEKQREKTRTLIVHKDEGGYGLTLSGDKPTRVQTVRVGGASHRAGVREGDVIIKVNGQQVTDSLHGEVVKLIQAGSYVALTVVHTSRILQDGNPSSVGGGVGERRDSCRQPNITGPQPADEELQRRVHTDKILTIQLMMEKQTREIEEIRSQLARSNSKKLRNRLQIAEKNLADLENQAQQLRQASPDKPPPELRMRVGPLPPTPGGPTSATSFSSSSHPFWSQSPGSTSTGGDSYSSSPPVAPPRVDSLGFIGPAGVGNEAGGAAPPLPARNSEPAPAPPPRNQAGGGLPPPPPKLSRPVSHESLNNVSVGSGGGNGHQRRGSHAAALPPTSLFRGGGAAGGQVSPPRPSVSHTRTRSSPVSLEQTLEVANLLNLSSSGVGGTGIDTTAGGRKSPRYETPPGTPPPPYPQLVTWAGLLTGGVDIITMEDDDCEEEGAEGRPPVQQLPLDGDHGPFNSLQELLQHPAHLAVFFYYVINNADPAPLLFQLITEAYKQGSAKEMRKWAYEIHSCFVMPGSPLELPNLEPQDIKHIDNFLSEEQNEREESLQKLFWKVRSRARDILKLQLDDFRAKRVAGMANMYGPDDHELRHCEENSQKRTLVIEERLLPILESMSEEGENASDRNATLCSSLATVLSKTFNLKSAQTLSLLEKTPTFVSKEKGKEKFFGKVFKKKTTVKGHVFILQHYEQVTYCNHTQLIIWGIGPQGYRCQNCDFDVHKKHVYSVEEACVGPSQEKKKYRSSLINFGLPRSHNPLPSHDPGRKPMTVSPSPPMRNVDAAAGCEGLSSFHIYATGLMAEDQVDESLPFGSGAKSQVGSEGPLSPLDTRPLQPGGAATSQQQPHRSLLDSAALKLNASAGGDLVAGFRSANNASDSWGGFSTSSGRKGDGLGATSNAVKRSESDRDGSKRTTRLPSLRKNSDPNLAQNRLSLDADGRVSKSGSSSCSSIAETSRLFDQLPPSAFQQLPPSQLQSPVSGLRQAAGVSPMGLTPGGGGGGDSDLEADVEGPDWRTSIPRELLVSMKPREQKRQDVINELFQTERSHVRNLKILDSIFRRPLIESGLMPRDMIDRLFPNIEEVLNVHQTYSLAMRERAKKGFPIGSIGDILANMFLGTYGDTLIRVGAEFTQNQKFTIEELKKWRAREPRLEQFLSDIERNPICRRLQLQGILPVEHQRLVKYPLLLEGLAKHCDPAQDQEEYEIMREVTNRTRQILESIDKQVAEAQNKQKLMDIQRFLDTTGLEKLGPDDHICKEFRNLDLTKYRLIYDGLLTLNLGGENKRLKNIELHVLLLEECVMFLQKQDEKFHLKFHTGAANVITGGGNREDAKKFLSPVIKFSSLLVRPVAINKRAFYLMNTTNSGAQLYELVASSEAERSTWLRHIGEATAVYKSRDARREFRTSSSMSNMGSVLANGRLAAVNNRTSLAAFDAAAVMSGDDLSRKPISTPAGRSQSFNEAQSIMRREAIANRPLPSPPVERFPQEEESLESKLKRLSQKDEEVARALEEKQKIISDIFNIPPEEYDSIADIVTLHQDKKDAEEVLLSLINQVDSLSRYANDCLKVSEEEEPPRLLTPSSDKLLQISAGLSSSLTKLLSILQEQEEEKVGWRQDLLLTSRTFGSGGSGVAATATNNSSSNPEFPCSRPNSFLSLESSDLGSEDGNRSDLLFGSNAAGEDLAPSGLPQSSTPVKDTTPTNEELAAAGGENGGGGSHNNSLLFVETEAESGGEVHLGIVAVDPVAGFVTSDC